MNDTMSKDPRAIAEAIATANRKPSPALPYNTKAIYFEEWRRVVEPPFDRGGPEESWKIAVADEAKNATLEATATFTEADFRSLCRSHAHAWYAQQLSNLLNEQMRLAKAQRDVATYTVQRQSGGESQCLRFDIANGCVRKHCDGAGDDQGSIVDALKRLLGVAI